MQGQHLLQHGSPDSTQFFLTVELVVLQKLRDVLLKDTHDGHVHGLESDRLEGDDQPLRIGQDPSLAH